MARGGDLVNSLAAGTPRFREKREAILDGAARLFNRNGIKGGTLTDVARSVGLITNSITYYYRKKEDLVSACLLRSIGAIDKLADEAAAASTVEARVRGFVSAYVGMLTDIERGRHPEVMGFSDVRSLTAPHDKLVFDAYTGMFRRIRSLLVPNAHEAQAGPPPSRMALNARGHLLLTLTTWTRAWIDRYEPDDHPRAAHWVSDILWSGLAAAGQAWQPSIETPDALDPQDPNDEGNSVAEAYLRAATRLVNDQGYRGASVDRIAAELNLTKGSFYHHHETKEELVSACFEQSFAVMRRVQRAVQRQPGSGWEHLMRASQSLVNYQVSERGPLLRVSAWSALPDALRRDKMRTIGRLGEHFGAFIVDGMIDGSIRPLDQAIAARMVNGMINAAAELSWWVPGVNVENAADLYARPLLKGLVEREPVSTPATTSATTSA